MLNESVIRKHLSDIRNMDMAIHLLETTSSTNDYFKNKKKTTQLEFCFAEEQTQGRGRLGRSWQAPKGANIIMSCRWLPPPHLISFSGLSSCISLSLIAALKKFDLPSSLACKWPNDLFYDHKKLAGILIELYVEKGQINEIIIGIGLNVNMLHSSLIEPSLINQPWTSLQMILNAPQDRNLIAALLIDSLANYLHRFSEKGFLDFQDEWQKYDYLKGKWVEFPQGNEIISGMACGINSLGYLVIQKESGEVVACSAGEVLPVKLK